jgi:uncharacterized protein YcgL (UPF0745 family)
MNNEPVAWMTAQGIQDVCTVNEKEEMGNDFDDYTIPLYIHPAEHDLGIAEAIGFEKGHESASIMLRQQQAEIDRLNYDLDGFKQNFFVSGFHLQIKMANEQLVKQQEQIDALKKELYFKDYYEELPNTPVDLLRKAQEK